jgi:hypothetical protein
MTDTSKADPADSNGSHKKNPERGRYSDSSMNLSPSEIREGDGVFHEGAAVAGVESRVRAKQLDDDGSVENEAPIDEPAVSKADHPPDDNDQDPEGFSDDASADFNRDASFVLGKPKQVGSTSPPEEELDRLDKDEPELSEEVAQTGAGDNDSVSDLSRDQSMDLSEDSRHGIGKPQRLDIESDDSPPTKSRQWLTGSATAVGAASDPSAQVDDGVRPPTRKKDVNPFEDGVSAATPAGTDESTFFVEETLSYDDDSLAEGIFEDVSEDAAANALDDASQDIAYDELGEPKLIDSASPDCATSAADQVAAPVIEPDEASAAARSEKSAAELNRDPSSPSSHEPSVAIGESQQLPDVSSVIHLPNPFFDPTAEDAPRLSDGEKPIWLKAVWARLNQGDFGAVDLKQAEIIIDECLSVPSSAELADGLECLQRQLTELTADSGAPARTTESSTSPSPVAISPSPSPSPSVRVQDPAEPEVETLSFQAEDFEFEARLVTVDGNHLHARRLYLDAARIWREAGLLESAKSAVRDARRHLKRLAASWAARHPDEFQTIGRTITEHANSLDDESQRQRHEQERERIAVIESQRQVIFSLLVTHEDVLAALSPTAQAGLSEKDRNDLAPEAMELTQIRRRLESGTQVTLDMLRRDADALNRILIAVLVRQRKSSSDARVQGQLEELGYGLSLPGPPQVDAQAAQPENAPRARQLFKDAYCRAFVSGRKSSVESSVRLYSTAVRQTPGEPLYRYFLGLSLYRNDEPEAGLEQVQIGAQLEKDQQTPTASVNHWLDGVDREQRAWLERIRKAAMKTRGSSAGQGTE